MYTATKPSPISLFLASLDHVVSPYRPLRTRLSHLLDLNPLSNSILENSLEFDFYNTVCLVSTDNSRQVY